MNVSTSKERPYHQSLALAIAALLCMIYVLTFSGTETIIDESYSIDAIESVAIEGNLTLNQSGHVSKALVLPQSDVEPAQLLLAVPLYWLAYHIPWVGQVHAVYLLNPIITTLMAFVLFFYVLDLGYDRRTALIATFLYSLTTIVWVYSKTFFREPLTTLNLLCAAFFLERWRKAVATDISSHWRWLALGVVFSVLMLLSKDIMIAALPILLALAYPGVQAIKKHRREVILIGTLLSVIAASFILLIVFFHEYWEFLPGRYFLPKAFQTLTRGYRNTPLRSLTLVAEYLASPGKGIFWFSPVLFLSFGAPFVLPAQRWRESWLPLLFTILFVGIYGGAYDWSSGSGVGWGTRYFYPLIPFLMIAALPLIDRMLHDGQRWTTFLLAVISTIGFIIQFGGVYVRPSDYFWYQARVTGLSYFSSQILWSFRWSQIVGHLLLVPQVEPDIAWLVGKPDWIAFGTIVAGVLLASAMLVLVWCDQQPHARYAAMSIRFSPIIIVVLMAFLLWRIYDDPRYEGDRQDLHNLRTYLEEDIRPDNKIVLASPGHVRFFMNYYKGEATWYSLQSSPGDRNSCEVEPRIISDEPKDLLSTHAFQVIERLMQGALYSNDPIWVVSEIGPNTPCGVRSVQWFLAKYGYPIYRKEYGYDVWLMEYLPLRAPTENNPAVIIDAQFGDSMRLVGYDLITNDGITTFKHLRPGDLLGISLLWKSTNLTDIDYTVAVHYIDPTGRIILQQDHPPMDGFAPTSTWEIGDLIRDNYGFILPDDLSPGVYQIGIAVYSWPSLERLPISGKGLNREDYLIPVSLTVVQNDLQ